MNRKYLYFILFALASLGSARSEELNATELAKALGLQWWSIDASELKTEHVEVYFEIVQSTGKTIRTGSSSGLTGTQYKVFCQGGPDGKLHLSAVWESGSFRTTLDENPFSETKLTTFPVKVGSVGKMGDVLKKASSLGSVSSSQEIGDGEVGLRFIVKPTNR